MRTITDANSEFSISVPSVFPTPQPIQGYATDDAFDTENVAPNEALMGVDGNLSGGYTPYPVKLKFVLQADSASNDVIDQWRQYMDSATEAYPCNATIAVPGIGKRYTFIKGWLTGTVPTVQGKKVLMPQTYEITFQQLITAPM